MKSTRVFTSLLALLLLSGCSTTESMGQWVREKSEKLWLEEQPTVAIPDPGREVNLEAVWRASVAGKPDKDLAHPGRLVVHGADLFVGTYDGAVIRVDRGTGHALWEQELGGGVAGGVAADGDRVYAGTVEGAVVALDRGDGHELWRFQAPSAIASAPTVANDLLLVVTLDNRTIALNAATGARRWHHAAPAESLVVMGAATPVVADGQVYVGYSSGEVFALEQNRGEPLWAENLTVARGRSELEMLQDVDAAVVVAGSRLFAVNHQGRMTALDRRNGGRLWQQTVSAVRTPLLVDNKVLFVSETTGHLTAIQAEDGAVLWRTLLTDALLTAPVAFHGELLVADSEGRLFALEPNEGRVVGRTLLEQAVFADPVVVGAGLYLWTNKGGLIRYE